MIAKSELAFKVNYIVLEAIIRITFLLSVLRENLDLENELKFLESSIHKWIT